MKHRVWAPRAATLDVFVDGAPHRLTKDDRGVWSGDVAALVAGARYGLSVDGGAPIPDPRSRSQPDGVHALSEVVELASFRWTDAAFAPVPLPRAVIYELHVGAFTAEGTFDAAAGKLEHLVELGVTHVELMPVAAFPGARGWGYDGVALFAPHRAYGGAKGLMRFVDAAHARGLAVILDVVYNHLGPSGNYLGKLGPYFTDKVKTPWGCAVNLDGPGSDEVRRFLLDNARMWLTDFHIDGLRLDAVHALHDEGAVPFIEQVAALAASLPGGKVVIAESDLNDPRVVRSRAEHGLGCDAQWSDDLHHALHAWLTGERDGYYVDYGGAPDVAKALAAGFVLDGRYSTARERTHGRAYELPPSRLLSYLQTHDQVGNRARGERIGHLVSLERQKIGAALYLVAPFVPMLFMGEEWAASAPFLYFTDHQEPELAASVRKGRQNEFGAFGWAPEDVPDPQAEGTFTSSRLDWRERAQGAHASMLAFYGALLRLRRTHPALADDAWPEVSLIDERTVLVRRAPATGRALVVLANVGPAHAVDVGDRVGPLGLLLSSSSGVEVKGVRVHLPADTVAIFEGPAGPLDR